MGAFLLRRALRLHGGRVGITLTKYLTCKEPIGQGQGNRVLHNLAVAVVNDMAIYKLFTNS